MTAFDLDAADRDWLADFLTGAMAPADFHHREHVRLAYILLVRDGFPGAVEAMRAALLGFLDHHGIDRAKYHETLTEAWVRAVRHFMDRTSGANGAADFIARQPLLLDARIMRTHYSAERLNLPGARSHFVAPDLEPIPAPVGAVA